MGFMQSYKRLDNLCRDTNGVGISGYIADMEQLSTGRLYVPSWATDYLQLKHYRHIRNRIAHEVDAAEETLCSPEDEIWVENFYQRILRQEDPLAMYHKALAVCQPVHPAKSVPIHRESYFPVSPVQPPKQSKGKQVGKTIFIVAVLGILVTFFVSFFNIFSF